MTQTKTTRATRSLHSALKLLRALTDSNRLTLIGQLAACRRPCTVGELASCCAVDLSGVSRHLAALRDAGVLEAERRGRTVHYSLRTAELVAQLRGLADALETCCPDPRSEAGTESDDPNPDAHGASPTGTRSNPAGNA